MFYYFREMGYIFNYGKIRIIINVRYVNKKFGDFIESLEYVF